MLKRKTSRVRKKRDSRQLHLKVNSPRIFGFTCLRFIGKCVKFTLLIGLLVGAGWGAKVGLRKVFIDNEEFRLEAIELESNGPMTVADFVAVTGVDPAGSVFSVTLSEVRERLEEFPGVLDVDVSRRLPGTLRVEVRERIPVAWLECRSQGIFARHLEHGLLVDGSGVVFPCESWWEERAASLPSVVVMHGEPGDFESGKKMRHEEAVRALNLVVQSQRMLAEQDWGLAVVGVQNNYSLTAATTKGTVVTFGMYEHQRQLADLVALDRFSKEEARGMERVNLIPERNIPVIFRPGSAAPRTEKSTPEPENRLEKDIRAILNRS
jgi:cell division protein FtsQ